MKDIPLATTPRQLCDSISKYIGNDYKFARRPRDRFRPDKTSWWLVPSNDLPHYKYGKYYFNWGDNNFDSLLCGLYMEKGLDEKLASVYTSKKAKSFIMDSSWNWYTFLESLNNGSFYEQISKIDRSLIPVLELHIDGGYVSEPTSFDPYQDKKISWDFYNFNVQRPTCELTLNTSKRNAYVLKLHHIKNIPDLTDSLNTLSEDNWLWLNVFFAMRIEKECIAEAISNPKLIWDNYLKYLLNSVIP